MKPAPHVLRAWPASSQVLRVSSRSSRGEASLEDLAGWALVSQLYGLGEETFSEDGRFHFIGETYVAPYVIREGRPVALLGEGVQVLIERDPARMGEGSEIKGA